MKKSLLLLCLLVLLFISLGVFGQQLKVTDFQKQMLHSISTSFSLQYNAGHQRALALAQSKGWVISRKTRNGGLVSLQGINSIGFPIYLITHNNVISSATTSTNTVQPDGVLGLNLSGSSTFLDNKLAIWDGGLVYKTHQEFAGKSIIWKDTASIINHATHVSGTMLAKGVYAPAKGMAFNGNSLLSYDFNNDVTEMSEAASGLLLSNHSYGDQAGWNLDENGNWDWYGLPGDTVDYLFGFYGARTQSWDNIAYNAPYYLIVESAGNSHASTGPAIGQDYYGYASLTDQTFVDKGPRPPGISSNNGYGVISGTGNAKNILTVGAINPLPYGPSGTGAISIAYFSSWGPTIDGRIKPDIVGNGVDVTSTNSTGPASYLTLSGTSMAAPNITGSLYLLQEYYAEKTGNFMRAATLKGLACHTAVDAGNIGPDYVYGWGLLDMKKAAQAITDNGTKSLIQENTLKQGQTQVIKVTASGDGPLTASISWTDPPGTATPDGTVGNNSPEIINDLDIRISDGMNTFLPWMLNPANPSAPATTGDNILDNIEQIVINGAVPGKNYTITVSHKGTLQSGSQDFSVIITGVGGAVYCTSAPLSNADSRVNNVTLSNINYSNTQGCTSYTDNTNMTLQLEQYKKYPLSITLGTCGGNFNKAAKIFIDWNSDGVFESNELVATTGIINGTGTYITNITVPPTVIPGNYSLMRVVLTETGDTSSITACGNYTKGETQDYRVQFLQASIDAGVIAVVDPGSTGSCSGSSAITIRLKNYGSLPLTNIPLTALVTSPNKTVTTYNGTYTAVLQPLYEDNFTFPESVNISPGSSYIINASTKLAADADTANNQFIDTLVTGSPPIPANLTAYYCDNSYNYLLSGSGDGELLWYKHLTDSIPFAFGTDTSAMPPVNNTFYAGLNDFSAKIGPATKNIYPGGGYDQFTPSVNVSTQIPIIIQSARLYIGNSGAITFTVTNDNNEVVSQTTINTKATSTNPVSGAQADDPNDQGCIYQLNLLLPAAGNYAITATYDSTSTIYRNSAYKGGYPLSIGNLFSIIGNTATSGIDTAVYQNYYYFFYDMHPKTPGCASSVRQPVTIGNAVITQVGEVLNSNFSSGNQWYLDGNSINDATGQSYTPEKSGNYQLKVIVGSGCVLNSDNFVFVLSSTAQGNDIGLVVFPIPASSQLNIIFSVKAASISTLSLINMLGQPVYSKTDTLPEGNFSTAINTSNLPPGIYVLKILLGKKIYVSKVIKK